MYGWLSLLQPLIPDLPRDPQTLLHAKRTAATKSIAGGGLIFWLAILVVEVVCEILTRATGRW